MPVPEEAAVNGPRTTRMEAAELDYDKDKLAAEVTASLQDINAGQKAVGMLSTILLKSLLARPIIVAVVADSCLTLVQGNYLTRLFVWRQRCKRMIADNQNTDVIYVSTDVAHQVPLTSFHQPDTLFTLSVENVGLSTYTCHP